MEQSPSVVDPRRKPVPIVLRAYASLNDFLPGARRHQRLALAVEPNTALKDVIERVGIVHPEVDLAIVDGQPRQLDHRVAGGEQIAVYPRFQQLAPEGRLLPDSEFPPRFVLDVHLGRLAAYLRAAGYDTAWSHDAIDEALARQSAGEKRLLLTRDLGLLRRSIVQLGYWVRSTQPRWQLVEILARHVLGHTAHPFTRCLRCNGLLEPVEKRRVEQRLEPGTRRRHQSFWRCAGCDRVFWRGSHHARLQELLAWAESQARRS